MFKFPSLALVSSWLSGRILNWRFSHLSFDPSFGNLACQATLKISDRTKQICLWMTLYIYIYIYIYIPCYTRALCVVAEGFCATIIIIKRYEIPDFRYKYKRTRGMGTPQNASECEGKQLINALAPFLWRCIVSSGGAL